MPRPGDDEEADEDIGFGPSEAAPAPEPEPVAEARVEFVAPQKPLFKPDPAVPAKDTGATAEATPDAEAAPGETRVAAAIPLPLSEPQAGTGGKLRTYLNDVASMRRGRVIGAIGWAMLVLFVAGTVYGAVQYRKEIAAFWPSTAKLYEAAGAPINLLGLEFRNISYERQSENGLPVLAIKGSVVNVSDEVKTLPRLRVGLRDAKQQELYHWTFALPDKELKPKQSAEFTTRLSSPPVEARDLEVRFVREGDDSETMTPARAAAPAKAVPDAPH